MSVKGRGALGARRDGATERYARVEVFGKRQSYVSVEGRVGRRDRAAERYTRVKVCS